MSVRAPVALWDATVVRCFGPAWTWHGKAIPYSAAAAPYATPAIADERINGFLRALG